MIFLACLAALVAVPIQTLQRPNNARISYCVLAFIFASANTKHNLTAPDGHHDFSSEVTDALTALIREDTSRLHGHENPPYSDHSVLLEDLEEVWSDICLL